MAGFEEDDVDGQLEDSGHRIVVDGVEQPCDLYLSDEIVLDEAGRPGQKASRERALVKTAHFPELGESDSVIIDGVDYTILQALRLDDAVTELRLRRS